MSRTDPVSRTIQPVRRPTERPGPVGGKRDANRQKRTQVLSEAALRLFLAHGIEAVTIDDIVREAGVAKGSFYRYFGDKADVVSALLTPLTAALQSAFHSCERALAAAEPGAALSDPYLTLAAELTLLATRDANLIRLYLQESRAPAVGARRPIGLLAEEILDRATALADSARRHRLTRETNPRLTALAVVGAVEHLMFRFLTGDPLGPTEQIPDTLISLVLDGVRARAEPGPRKH